jgi:hypothetical protein
MNGRKRGGSNIANRQSYLNGGSRGDKTQWPVGNDDAVRFHKPFFFSSSVVFSEAKPPSGRLEKGGAAGNTKGREGKILALRKRTGRGSRSSPRLCWHQLGKAERTS